MINLKEKEKIILIKRRHLMVLILKTLLLTLIFLGIVVFMVASMFISLTPLSESLAGIGFTLKEIQTKFFVLFICSLSLLILWQIFLVKLAHYYLDCWIVTNERTIHTELLNLFNRFLSTIYHHRIQDLSVDVKGILPTIFHYGNIQIQTAGAFREFVLREIPEPYKTKEVISSVQIEFSEKVKETGAPSKEEEKDIEKLVD